MILLSVYFFLGAYYYSRSHSLSLVDSMFDCYSMLSMSKLPESFNLHGKRFDPLGAYELMKIGLNKTAENPQNGLAPPNDNFVWDLIYLLIGLNLISIVAHFAKLSLAPDDDELMDDASALDASKAYPTSQCNGHAPSIMAKFDDSSHEFNGAQPTSYLIQQAGQQLMATPQDISAQSLAPVQGHQHPMSLAELFVVGQQESPIETSFTNYNQQAQHQHQPVQHQHQQQTSDVSFASDRSTGSLCLRHQQMSNNQQQAADLYRPTGTLHRHQNNRANYDLSSQLANHSSSQTHLYLPTNNLLPMQTQTLMNNVNMDDEAESKNVERMLESCMKQSHQPTGKLIKSNSGILNNKFDGRQQVKLANNVAQHEQDSNSLNTNSNTISSISSRTIKPQGNNYGHTIGFVEELN